MKRPKLSIDEQIADMQAKGITFNHSDICDAKRFLKCNNYYFKLKAYERNYDKYRSTPKQGKYINLDFAYLKELSTLDMYLRKIILSMALDIEHALKVQLLFDLSQNSEEDGYAIVQEYLEQDYMPVKTIHDKIGKSATSDLIKKDAMKMIIMPCGKSLKFFLSVILSIYINYITVNILQEIILVAICGR